MVRWSLVVAMVLVACKPREAAPLPGPKASPTAAPTPGSPVAPGTLKRANVETAYGVVVPAGADLAALEQLARHEGRNLAVARVSLAEMLDEDRLAFLTKDLARPDADGVKASPAIILLHGSGTDGMKLAREIATVARDIAVAAHGWVFDPATVRIYPAATFHAHIPGDRPDVRDLIVVHSITGAHAQPFLDTAGLRRYGFPELYVAEVATGQVHAITHLINGAAQTLLAGGDVNDRGELVIDFHALGWGVGSLEGGTGKAVWKTRWAREGDGSHGDELVVELVPPSGAGAAGAAKLIAECFGQLPDEVVMLADDDPDLLAAAAKARADLVMLRPHFTKGLPPGEQLLVKARFTGDNGQAEWMWVDVVALKRDSFEGTLANEPDRIDSLQLGQKVSVKLPDTADYVHVKADGTRAGGYSIEVLRKRGLVPGGTAP